MKEKMKILSSFLILAVGVVIGILIMRSSDPFVIDYVLCGKNSGDCFVAAKFDDMWSCEAHREKGNWLCDTVTDPLKPDCRVALDSSARSYCSDTSSRLK